MYVQKTLQIIKFIKFTWLNLFDYNLTSKMWKISNLSQLKDFIKCKYTKQTILSTSGKVLIEDDFVDKIENLYPPSSSENKNIIIIICTVLCSAVFCVQIDTAYHSLPIKNLYFSCNFYPRFSLLWFYPTDLF